MYDLRKASKAYLWHCQHEKRLSAGTLRAYGFDMKGFSEYAEIGANKRAEKIPVEHLDRPLLQGYWVYLHDRWKVATVKRKLACLKGFFLFLEDRGEIAENPFLKMKVKFRQPVSAPETMELREVDRILHAAYGFQPGENAGLEESLREFLYYRDIAVLELLFATGVRVHELCGLTCRDYHRQSQRIRIRGKGGKERLLYISNEEVVCAMDNYLKHVGRQGFRSEYVFVNRWGRPLSCQAVRNIVTKYCGLAGIGRHITPHAFRHTFASLLLEEGVDIKYIQEFLGHSSISTTQIYLHPSERKKREILAKKHPRQRLNGEIRL